MTSLHKLNRGFIFTICVLALLSFSSFIIIYKILQYQEHDSNLINIAGRQRMLSQQLAQFTLSLNTIQTPQDQRRIKHQIQEIMNTLQKNLEDLKNGNLQRNLPALDEDPLYHELIIQLENDLGLLIRSVQKRILENPPEKFNSQAFTLELMNLAAAFLQKMDHFTLSLAQDSRQKVIFLRYVDILLFSVILTTLAIIGFFIFRPLIRLAFQEHLLNDSKNTELEKKNTRLQEYVEELKSAEEEIRVQADELQNTNLKLEILNQKLEHIVQKRTQKLFDKNRLLQQVNEELNVSNLELDSLIYRISHDLRSPLATILGLFNVLKFEKDENTMREFMGLAEGEALRMDRFIQSIINFAQSNRLKIEPEKIQLRKLIEDCLVGFNKMPGYHTLNCQIVVQGDLIPFYTDELRLRMIINNLISNAIQFQQSPAIDNSFIIEANLSQEELHLIFWDNGVGIREECIDKIFDMFYRGSDKSRGSGLGLYIVKSTLKHLKGKIEVNSQKGIFTQFDIWIPNLALNSQSKNFKLNDFQLSAS